MVRAAIDVDHARGISSWGRSCVAGRRRRESSVLSPTCTSSTLRLERRLLGHGRQFADQRAVDACAPSFSAWRRQAGMSVHGHCRPQRRRRRTGPIPLVSCVAGIGLRPLLISTRKRCDCVGSVLALIDKPVAVLLEHGPGHASCHPCISGHGDRCVCSLPRSNARGQLEFTLRSHKIAFLRLEPVRKLLVQVDPGWICSVRPNSAVVPVAGSAVSTADVGLVRDSARSAAAAPVQCTLARYGYLADVPVRSMSSCPPRPARRRAAP